MSNAGAYFCLFTMPCQNQPLENLKFVSQFMSGFVSQRFDTTGKERTWLSQRKSV